MTFFDYLFYKYYRWQVRVGRKSQQKWESAFAAVVNVATFVFFTFLGIVEIIGISFQIPTPLVPNERSVTVYVFGILGLCYWFFMGSKRYERIEAYYQNETKEQARRGVVYASLWPVLIFVLVGIWAAILIWKRKTGQIH